MNDPDPPDSQELVMICAESIPNAWWDRFCRMILLPDSEILKRKLPFLREEEKYIHIRECYEKYRNKAEFKEEVQKFIPGIFDDDEEPFDLNVKKTYDIIDSLPTEAWARFARLVLRLKDSDVRYSPCNLDVEQKVAMLQKWYSEQPQESDPGGKMMSAFSKLKKNRARNLIWGEIPASNLETGQDIHTFIAHAENVNLFQ